VVLPEPGRPTKMMLKGSLVQKNSASNPKLGAWDSGSASVFH
jgi:hypothetical protein